MTRVPIVRLLRLLLLSVNSGGWGFDGLHFCFLPVYVC